MALLMKESNEILSSVYRATPNLFQRFMPQVQAHMQAAAMPPLHFPLAKHDPMNDEDRGVDDEDDDDDQSLMQQQQQQQLHHSHHHSLIHQQIAQHHLHHLNQQQLMGSVTPPTLSPHANELSIDQNCTPPSSSSSTNSTITSVSPLDFNSFVAAATASTPVMSPLMMPTPKVSYLNLIWVFIFYFSLLLFD